MRFYVAILALAVAVILVQPHGASAVGYERYEVSNGHVSRSGVPPKSGALKKATFWEKCPAVLDDVAFFVRDVLSQFGLAEHRSR